MLNVFMLSVVKPPIKLKDSNQIVFRLTSKYWTRMEVTLFIVFIINSNFKPNSIFASKTVG
jgi:hypothetical protein